MALNSQNVTSSNGVVTRFPPSPTGYLHIGRARTALFNYLFAKQHKGTFIYRSEDTDKSRSKKVFEENIIDCLNWLGLHHDNEVIARQSERNDIYKKYLKKLIDEGKAYLSKEEGTEEGQRGEVIRFKNLNKKIQFTDIIRGQIEFDTTELGDFVIAKSTEEPLYHLAVVIDDFEMKVTHIIRGEDGISNTPRQILIQEAIGAPRPIYAHLPLILAPDKSRLSGRKGAIAVTDYREKGYLPEAIVNFLALLGWNPGTDQELFSLEELLTVFDLAKVQKAGAVLNEEKLKWFNKQYIAKLSEEAYLSHALKYFPEEYAAQGDMLKKIALISRERISTFGELRDFAAQGEFAYFFTDPSYLKESLMWKNEKDLAQTQVHLEKALELLGGLSDADFTEKKVKETLWPYAETVGKGNLLWPVRFALSGREKSPDPFILAGILGKATTLKRLQVAADLIKNAAH